MEDRKPTNQPSIKSSRGFHRRMPEPVKFPEPADQQLRHLIHEIRLRRQHLGLSQAAVNERLGVASDLVSKWENGIRNPRGLELQAWAATLGCKLVLEPEVT